MPLGLLAKSVRCCTKKICNDHDSDAKDIAWGDSGKKVLGYLSKSLKKTPKRYL